MFAPSVDNPTPSEPDKAYVTDEAGATHVFIIIYDDATAKTGPKFIPMPTARSQQTPSMESLVIDNSTSPATYVLKRRYGTTIRYERTSLNFTAPDDRLDGSLTQQEVTYARARTVTDRLGYQLDYDYSSAGNLVPRTISVHGHSDQVISIAQNSQGLITAIADPKGNKTQFAYTSRAYASDVGSIWQLTSVTTPDGAVTSFTYDMDSNHAGGANAEEDQTPHSSMAPTGYYWHCELGSITNPLGQTFAFSYALDHSKHNFMDDPGVFVGYYVQTGQPRNIRRVTLPDGNFSEFLNVSNVWLELGTGDQSSTLVMPGVRRNVVTDASGFARTYSWDQSAVVPLPQVRLAYPSTRSFSEPKLVVYKRMTVQHGELGAEIFEFDLDAALALSRVTDFSGNITSYQYGDAWSEATSPLLTALGVDSTAFGRYPDPTSQTNALGGTKVFTYTSANPGTGEAGGARLMKSMTDEAGRHTVYAFDSLGRRVSETMLTAVGGVVVRSTLFEYADSGHPGFMTKRTVKALSGDTSGATDLVTQYVPDDHGRLAQEIVDPAGLHLVTSYTYDLNGSKLSATDPRGNTTWFGYDPRSRLVQVTYADGTRRRMTYDVAGNKTVEVDENNHATLFQYDAMGRLVAQARHMGGGYSLSSSGQVTSIPSSDLKTQHAYDALGSKISVTDPRGGVVSTVYDALRRPITITDAVGAVTHLEYRANSGGTAFDSSGFKPTRSVDARGYVTTVTYDALYRPVSKSSSYGSLTTQVATTLTEYDAVGNVVALVDPVGRRTETDYDALNRPWRVRYGITAPNTGQINADYGFTLNTFTSTGLKWEAVDEAGNSTTTGYDGAGRAVLVTMPAVDDGSGTVRSGTVQTIYDAVGNVVATIDPLLRRSDFAYDVRNRRTDALQPAVPSGLSGTSVRPNVRTFYDAVGNVTAVVDVLGNKTETTYDEANRPLVTQAPPVPVYGGAVLVRPTTARTYDKNGNILTLTDPNGHVTQNTYDALNHLVTTTNAANITVTNAYDLSGNLVSVRDGLNQETVFEYDGLNRLTRQTDPAGQSTVFAYDGVDKTSRQDSKGQITLYAYDARHRLVDIHYLNHSAEDRTHAYDLVGNLLSVQEPGKNGVADVAYAYDALRRVASETSSGVTHTHRYDLVGNRISTRYGLPGGGEARVVTSAYDALNRLSTLTEGGRQTAHAYDLRGGLLRKTLPDGQTIATTYDALGRQVTIVGGSSQGQLYRYAYLYDLVGNLRQSFENTSGVSGRTLTLSYDGADRLVAEDEKFADGSPDRHSTTTYDAANNRTGKTEGAVVTTYVYNSLNQLTSWSDTASAGSSYTYDLNGNRLTRSVGAQTDNYTYDSENRLISLVKNTSSGVGTYLYQYDYRTRRVLRDESGAGGVSAKVVFSGGLSVSEYEGGSSAPDVEYVRGSDIGGGVRGILYSLRGGQPSYAHYDSRGDVTTRTSSGGAITYQATYRTDGRRQAEVGTSADRQRGNTKDEDATGLLNEGFRYRDLETLTFITRDPAGFVDGPNLYAYVNQNPWTKFDPEGLSGDLPELPPPKLPLTDKDISDNKGQRKSNLDQARPGSQWHYSKHEMDISISAKDIAEKQKSVEKDFGKFASFGNPKANEAFVTVNGDKAFFSLRGPKGYGSVLIGNDEAVAVKITSSKTDDKFIQTAETLGDHQLIGVRKWYVEKVGETRIRVGTEAYEMPRGGLNRIGFKYGGGKESQDNIWKTYLENINKNHFGGSGVLAPAIQSTTDNNPFIKQP